MSRNWQYFMTSLAVTLLAYMLCSCRTVVPCVAETVVRDTVRDVRTEVLKDGRVFVYGVGGYDGTNPFESGNILSVISALGERIDALNEHVTALEARIAALEGA